MANERRNVGLAIVSKSATCAEWLVIISFILFIMVRDHHGRDHMVVGLTTTYAISAYDY